MPPLVTIRGKRIVVAVVAALCLTNAAPAFAEYDTGLAVFAGGEKYAPLSYSRLVQLMNTFLGNAQQVNILIDACHSGGMLGEAGNLKMPFVLGVGDKNPKSCSSAGAVKEDANPPGRLKAGQSFFFGYMNYATKALQNATTPPNIGALLTAAENGVAQDPITKAGRQQPDSKIGNSANVDLKINGGVNSNHALIFVGDNSKPDDIANIDSSSAQYNALASDRYGFKKAGNSLQFYFDDEKPRTTPSGAKIDGEGSKANLEAALKNIMVSADANPKKELVNLFFFGHGYGRETNAPKRTGMSNVPRDGAYVMGGPGGATTTFQLETDSTFWTEFGVGVVTTPGLERVHPPQFSLAVVDDAMSGPVTIAIDGLSLGAFDLPPSAGGAEIDIDLPDSFAAELIALASGASSVDVSFTLGASDWFQFATKDDIYLNPDYVQSLYGFGLATFVEPTVPEPPTWFLVALGFVAVAALCRGRTRTAVAQTAPTTSSRQISSGPE